MSHEVKISTEERFPDVVRAVESAFGEEVSDEEVQRKRSLLDLDRVIYIEDDGQVVSGGATYTLRSTVPGNVIPTGGVTLIGVRTSHRRRGLLTAMMRQQLDDIHERGEPIATLWASEASIYGRYGYGLASLQANFDIARDRGRFINDPGPRGNVRMMPLDGALDTVKPIFDKVQAATPGMFERTRTWWEQRHLKDMKEWREGASERYLAVWSEDGAPRAYANYRIKSHWEHEGPTGPVILSEVMATDTVALREMWRFLLGVDLTDRVKSAFTLLPLDSPLFSMLYEPRRLKATLGDGLWLRIIDLKAALEARTYDADGEIVIEVQDAYHPSNTGCWRVVARAGQAEVTRSEREPHLSLDIASLGSLYLGTFTFAQLMRAGRVDVLDGDALRSADAMFRTDIAPWCPEIF
jgi:predicted acetyltransferase